MGPGARRESPPVRARKAVTARAKRPVPKRAARGAVAGRARAVREPAPPVPLGAAGRTFVAVALVLAWLVIFWPQLGGSVFVIGDAGQYRPFSDYSRARHVQVHERTFWNPYVFLGVPAAASLADSRPQWLPDPLLGAWDGLTASPRASMRLLLVGVLAGAFALAALARALFGCGPAAAALAGTVPMLSTAVTGPLSFGHDSQTWALAMTPALLLATRHWFVAPPGEKLGRAALLALAMAALALAGHPQFLVFGVLLALPLALSLAFETGRPARLAGFGLAAALGLALASPAWLPALLYGGGSVRANTENLARDVMVYSGNVLDVAALFWPPAAGFGEGPYRGGLRAPDFPIHVGVVIGLCAALGALAGRRARGASWPWLAFAAFAMAASLGVRLAPLQGFLASLPVLGAFRTPIVWLVPAALALALLAARGLTALERASPARHWPSAILLLTAAAEMSLVSLPVLRRATGDVARLAPPPPYAVAASASGDSLHRAFTRRREEFFTNAWVAWRVRTVGGLHGAAPAPWDAWRAAGLFARESCLRALAVRYVPSLEGLLADPAHFDTLANGTLALRDALPRAYAAGRLVASASDADVLASLSAGDFDATSVAYVTDPAGVGEYPGSAGAAVRWARDDPDRQELVVSADAPAFLVVADAWAPGWRARLDGRAAGLRRVNGVLRGIAVPAGTHTIELRYRPPGWDAARTLAGVAFLACCALAIGDFATRRRAAAGFAVAAGTAGDS